MWIGCREQKFTKRKKDKMYPAFIYVLKFMLDDGSFRRCEEMQV
jgi:hypothetical protein